MKCKNCGKELKENDKYCGSCGAPVEKQPKNDKKKEINGKKFRKRWIVLILFLLVILISGGIYLMKHFYAGKNIVLYSDGDQVYRPQNEEIAWDKKSNVLYYDNLITVYLRKELSERKERKLAEQIDGKIVTRIHGKVQMIQIQVEPAELEEICSYADKLKQSEEVLDAFYDTPWMDIGNNEDKNPWSEDGTVIEGKYGEIASGNDWWAEAVDAYTAWDYVDLHKKELAEVTVGIIDNGFDIEHEDLKSQKGRPKIQALKDYEENTAADHGTHVLGVIGANNNSKGIRGIADLATIRYVDWTPKTEDNSDSDYISLISTGEYIRITDKMIQEESIINNSWGSILYTQDNYKNSNLYKSLRKLSEEDVSYEKYYQAYMNECDNKAKNCIAMMMGYELDGIEKYMIVQAAGNGGSTGVGIDATHVGTYAHITRKIYEEYIKELNEQQRKEILEKDINYENLKNHILIVGAVENNQKDNQYLMTGYSNYGETVDICAPGGIQEMGVYSTVTTKDDNYKKKSAPDGVIYSEMSGTSMAAPIVTGAVAVLWQMNPDLSANEIKQILTDTAGKAVRESGTAEKEVYSMLNIGNAVKYLEAEMALHSNEWYTESEEFEAFRFQKDGIVLDITKKTYGFSDQAEEIGIYENKNGIITLNGISFACSRMDEIKETVLTRNGEFWFNSSLYDKYKEKTIFYEIDSEENYPIILMPFDNDRKEADSKISEILLASYWKYMCEYDADSIIEEFLDNGNIKQYAWEISSEGADSGKYCLSGDVLVFMEGAEVHRLYYVTKSEIKKELKELFGSDLSWIPDHLFFEREYVPCYTDEERHPFYLLPIEQVSQKEAYSKLIENEEKYYGSYELHTVNELQYAIGVCYLELRDVNDDGTDELYLVHNSNIRSEYGGLNEEASYQYELWGYKKGCAVKMEEGKLLFSNGGWPSVCWSEYQDEPCLITSSSTESVIYEIHGAREDGSFGVISSFMYDWDTGSHMIDARSVSEEEWVDEVEQLMNNTEGETLFYKNGDTVYSKVQKVKALLEQ